MESKLAETASIRPLALTIGAAAVTLFVILGVLTGPSVVTCFNSVDGMGQCLRGKMVEVGLIPTPPVTAVANAEAVEEPEGEADAGAPVNASPQDAEVAVTSEPALDVAPAAPVAETEPSADEVVAATFGLLRAEPDGSVVIAGSGTPGSEVEVFANGEPLGVATVESTGDWVFVPEEPLPPGGLEITLGEAGKPGTAAESFIVVIDEDKTTQPLVVASTPGQASEVLQGLTEPAEVAVADAEQPVEIVPEVAAVEEPTRTEMPEVTVAEEPVAETDTAVVADAPEAAVSAIETPEAASAETPGVATPDMAVAALPEMDKPAAEAAADEPEQAGQGAIAADEPAQAAPAATVADKPEAEEPTVPTVASTDKPAAEEREPAVATLETPADAITNVEEAAPTTEMLPPTIDAIEKEGDRTFFAGAGPEGGTVRLYVDDEFVADAEVADGRWLVEAGDVLDEPSQRVRADLLRDGSADVTARAEVNFVVELPEPEAPIVVADANTEAAEPEPAQQPTGETRAIEEAPVTPTPGVPSSTEAAAPTQSAPTTPTPEVQSAPSAPTSSPGVTATTAPAQAEPETMETPEPVTVPKPAPQPDSAVVAEAIPTPESDPIPAADPVPAVDAAPADDRAPAVDPAPATEASQAADPEPAPEPVIKAPSAEPAPVSAPVPVPAPVPEPEPQVPTMVAVSLGDPEAQRFASGKAIIRRGDNLWTIARRVYGEGIKYTTIYDANTGQIRDPDRIYPGQVFNLPEGLQ